MLLVEKEFEAYLRDDLPEDILDLIKLIFDEDRYLKIPKDSMGEYGGAKIKKPLYDHDFFACTRWDLCLFGNNCDDDMPDSFLIEKNKKLYLSIDSEFKNYENEIFEFLNFIAPYVRGRKKDKFVGWYQGEGCNNPTYIHIQQQNNNNITYT